MLADGDVSMVCTDDRTEVAPVAFALDDRLPRTVLERPVLIVEDEAIIAWMLESLLEDMGFLSVSTAATGEEALAAAAERPPVLIVSDINLGPRSIDGVDAAAAICRRQTAPVVFVTGHASPDALVRIERDVPNALLLRKPITFSALRRAVSEVLERSPPH